MTRQLRAITFCSGIGAPEQALKKKGWKFLACSEVASFPCAVLAYHHPEIPNLGDMTLIDGGDLPDADWFIAGTPCQSFSVAGLRKGLDDDRGNLTLKLVRIMNEYDNASPERKPINLVWENVPGILSDRGNAFGCFLAALAGEDEALQPPGGRWTGAGYVLGPERSIAWIIKDAQYFGLAQRRCRVFLAACPRNGADPRKILFEFDGVRRDSAPSRKTGQEIAATITRRALDGGQGGTNCGGGNHFIVAGDERHNLVPYAFAQNQLGEVRTGGVFNTLNQNSNASGRNTPMVASKTDVRRLTPVECERLQGFPDNYTKIPWRGKEASDCPDGPRYMSIGNSMAVPVLEWIGERIMLETQNSPGRMTAGAVNDKFYPI